ncbi:maleylpyruvate isomerase family mycothiol-dependent enzyme [Blastococcus sp. CT_GayMR19]|uniref:maleylpyruvate isomerase family mycothiol-dependent enzyme n=1 Tax=Blastococcus sp. CT_GayMR19 TaxID=2559608 RepID=UPI00107313CE|nr:maleylpyruvate isomerase family mycothiol-dependent enzyme [Blastococcus sp. CT_GayMR19]TFV72876.1 maleylpyruvate isomerase family mycothiol-dependent enzyme [Blastococcus sp. CT_GayMR19]
MSDDIWPVVHAERRALAEDLSGLTPEQWRTPSLCPGWTVHDVLAHMVATAKETPPAFFAGMVTSGFRMSRFTEKRIATERAGGPAATLAAFRAVETATSAPPGPKLSWLGEAMVHAEDIRRPLGIRHDYPLAAVTAVTEFYAGSNVLIGGKRRVAGLTLKATDTDWAHGSGPVVEGPVASLMLATTGRRAALEDLSGPGLETLRSR